MKSVNMETVGKDDKNNSRYESRNRITKENLN